MRQTDAQAGLWFLQFTAAPQLKSATHHLQSTDVLSSKVFPTGCGKNGWVFS